MEVRKILNSLFKITLGIRKFVHMSESLLLTLQSINFAFLPMSGRKRSLFK